MANFLIAIILFAIPFLYLCKSMLDLAKWLERGYAQQNPNIAFNSIQYIEDGF